MNTTNQLILAILLFIYSFVFCRCFFYGLKHFFFKKSAYKKRKKGETFVEWLLYKRYWDCFPKAWLWVYYVLMILHLLVILLCICVSFLGMERVGEVAAKGVYGIDALFQLIVLILFWRPKDHNVMYGRWIDKRKH